MSTVMMFNLEKYCQTILQVIVLFCSIFFSLFLIVWIVDWELEVGGRTGRKDAGQVPDKCILCKQNKLMMGVRALESGKPGFKSCLCHLLNCETPGRFCFLTSLWLSFLNCKTRIMTFVTQGCYKAYMR